MHMNDLEWTTEKRKVSDLIPFEMNPRKMTEHQVEKLTDSIKKFNFVEIPAINADNKILAGHQRLRVMKMLGRGDEVIDVRVPSRMLTEREANEYNVRSNLNHGEFDFEILPNLFETEELIELGFTEEELGIIGFGDEVTDEELSQLKYEMVFDTIEDYERFVDLLKKIRGKSEQTLSYALLRFLSENVL